MKLIMWLTVVAMGFATINAHAQIPVTDTAAIAKSVENTVQQITHLKQQYDQIKQAYSAVTGNRGYGSFSTNPGEFLPEDVRAVQAALAGGGTAQASAAIQAIIDRERQSGGNHEAWSKAQSDQRWLRAASERQMMDEAFQGMQKRMEGLQSLQQQISTTQDPKAIQELTARINIEQGILQAEQSKIALIQATAQSDERLKEERMRDEMKKIIDSNSTGMAKLR